MLQGAVIRRFEIIGEAASKISEKIKNENPEVQWRLIKEMRNKLIHEYFGVSAITIYSTIKFDLPILKEQLNKTYLIGFKIPTPAKRGNGPNAWLLVI